METQRKTGHYLLLLFHASVFYDRCFIYLILLFLTLPSEFCLFSSLYKITIKLLKCVQRQRYCVGLQDITISSFQDVIINLQSPQQFVKDLSFLLQLIRSFVKVFRCKISNLPHWPLTWLSTPCFAIIKIILHRIISVV